MNHYDPVGRYKENIALIGFLWQDAGNIVLLNFASAKNPGRARAGRSIFWYRQLGTTPQLKQHLIGLDWFLLILIRLDWFLLILLIVFVYWRLMSSPSSYNCCCPQGLTWLGTPNQCLDRYHYHPFFVPCLLKSHFVFFCIGQVPFYVLQCHLVTNPIHSINHCTLLFFCWSSPKIQRGAPPRWRGLPHGTAVIKYHIKDPS